MDRIEILKFHEEKTGKEIWDKYNSVEHNSALGIYKSFEVVCSSHYLSCKVFCYEMF